MIVCFRRRDLAAIKGEDLILRTHTMHILLYVLAALVNSVFSNAEHPRFDCGDTNAKVEFSKELHWNISIGPSSDCTFQFIWPENAGIHILARVEGFRGFSGIGSTPGEKVLLFKELPEHRFYAVFGYHYDKNGVESKSLFFPPGGLNLSFITITSNDTKISLDIEVLNATKDALVDITEVIAGSDPVVITDNLKLGTTYVYTSDSKLNLNVITDGHLFVDTVGNSSFFDCIYLYDGHGATAKLLGTVYHHAPITSNVITLFPTRTAKLHGMALINNEDNLSSIRPHEVLYCFSWNDLSNHSYENQYNYTSKKFIGAVSLTEGTFPGAMTIISHGPNGFSTKDYPIITRLQFDNSTSVVQVYSGYVTNNMTGNFITELRADSKFPIHFPGKAITLLINEGWVNVSFRPSIYHIL